MTYGHIILLEKEFPANKASDVWCRAKSTHSIYSAEIVQVACNDELRLAKQNKAKQSKTKQSKAKQSKQSKAKQPYYMLTQAGYVAAIQLMWACGITACALRITSECSFTDLGRMDSRVGCWLQG